MIDGLAESYKPSKGMVIEAQRGLDWRKEHNRGGTAVGVARARDIVNQKNLSISTIKRMFSFFSRHEVDKKGKGFRPSEKGFPSNGRIAWALWGGDAGFSWSRAKMRSIRKLEKGKKEMPIPYRLKDEEDQAFMGRCMDDDLMKEEFVDLEDRFQVCSIQSRYNDSAPVGLSRLQVSFKAKEEMYQVDEPKGTIDDVSLIEVGEAKGHDLYIDETSLETAMDALGKNLPAYITHKGALDEDRILKEVGYFSEFYIEGEKLKAKNFKALESFREDEPSRYRRLFDIAGTMPDTFGVSLVFEAQVVFVFEDGSEIPADELDLEDRKGAIREFPSVRFISIKSADFVDAPASNRNGLFSSITKTQKNMDDQNKKEEIVEEKLEEQAPEVQAPEEAQPVEQSNGLEQRIKDLEDKIESMNGQLAEERKINETLSSFIEGEEPIEESSSEQIEEVSILEKFRQADGKEATILFREHKDEILKQL